MHCLVRRARPPLSLPGLGAPPRRNNGRHSHGWQLLERYSMKRCLVSHLSSPGRIQGHIFPLPDHVGYAVRTPRHASTDYIRLSYINPYLPKPRAIIATLPPPRSLHHKLIQHIHMPSQIPYCLDNLAALNLLTNFPPSGADTSLLSSSRNPPCFPIILLLRR